MMRKTFGQTTPRRMSSRGSVGMGQERQTDRLLTRVLKTESFVKMERRLVAFIHGGLQIQRAFAPGRVQGTVHEDPAKALSPFFGHDADVRKIPVRPILERIEKQHANWLFVQ